MRSKEDIKKYKDYIKSKEWLQMKLDPIQERGFKCEKCGKPTHWLQLHHKTYKRLYNERGNDLLLVCGFCHLKIHKLTKPLKALKRKYKNFKRIKKNEKKNKQNANGQELKTWYDNERRKIKGKKLACDYYDAVIKLNTEYCKRRKELKRGE